MLKFSTFMINTDDTKKLVDFYTKVLGESGWSGGGFTGWKLGDNYVMVGPHDKVKGLNQEPARLMANFEVDDVQAEYDRLIEAGAKSIAEPYSPGDDSSMKLATVADPDGNYLQLASPMGDMKSA